MNMINNRNSGLYRNHRIQCSRIRSRAKVEVINSDVTVDSHLSDRLKDLLVLCNVKWKHSFKLSFAATIGSSSNRTSL